MQHARRIHLRSMGNVYLPGRFTCVVGDAPLKLFGAKELSQLNRIFNHLRKGGVVVASGQWDKILKVLGYLEKKKRELATGALHDLPLQTKEERRHPTYRKRAGHWYDRHYQQVLSRLMVIAQDDRLSDIEPSIHIPYLLELLGELSTPGDSVPFLVPVPAIQKIQSDMGKFYYVPALEADMMVHSNVLPPMSQDTIELFQEGLLRAGEQMPRNVEILDMGCGCGCLSLLAARVFADCDVKVVATDILPEAIATTKLNIQRFVDLNKLAPDPAVVETTDGGNLFEPIGDRRFDLIIFNVPWVVSRPRSRAEIAICDEDQEIVRRFLTESPEHLNTGGHIILGYSDHSGAAAVENLEASMGEAGLRIESIFKKRSQSRSQKRKWETILVYDLSHGVK